MGANQNPCCWTLQKFSFLFSYYVIIDTEAYLADQLFIAKKVRVWFGSEYARPDSPYLVIFCKCRKRDAAAFEAAMEELPRKMPLCGHPDYVEYCADLKSKIEFARDHGGEMPNEKDCASAKAEQEKAERVS